VTLPRGFKAQAEREAARLRQEMGRRSADPIQVAELAAHLGVRMISADRLVARERLEELERLQSFAFSAATFDIRGQPVIVTNPLRVAGRLASDGAHELAHLLLKHELSEVREIDGVMFRTCKPDEEEQATSFGGTLLLPRPLLIRAALRGDTPVEIAEACGVTLEMARYRFNSTGVARQVQRRSG
jgi:Zn-dependent peptidase ImmA (M78 family)